MSEIVPRLISAAISGAFAVGAGFILSEANIYPKMKAMQLFVIGGSAQLLGQAVSPILLRLM